MRVPSPKSERARLLQAIAEKARLNAGPSMSGADLVLAEIGTDACLDAAELFLLGGEFEHALELLSWLINTNDAPHRCVLLAAAALKHLGRYSTVQYSPEPHPSAPQDSCAPLDRGSRRSAVSRAASFAGTRSQRSTSSGCSPTCRPAGTRARSCSR